MKHQVNVDEFDYHLPPELIAQTPLANRADSRLLVVDPVEQTLEHTHFYEIVNYLRPGDVLILNNSKVLPARLHGVKTDTGAHVELLLTKAVSEYEWIALAKPAKRLKVGTVISFVEPEGGDIHAPGTAAANGGNPWAEVVEVHDEGLRQVKFHMQESMEQFLDQYGSMPLPPYIQVPLQERDRYQTVYAETAGSVAAPTAGLHFTEKLLEAVRQKGVEVHFVTLHVGIGTFRPVQVDVVEEHVMHTESYFVPADVAAAVERAKQEGRRVIAVGTTALRTLESAGQGGTLQEGGGETGIFIYPGYRFQIVDALITNFHLPKSTLVMLVAALMGLDFTRRAYEEAVNERYRFFSFGDAMFITRRAHHG